MITRARHLAEYVLVRALLAAVLSLGYPRAVAASRALAGIFYRVGGRVRERALRNLRNTLPELGPRDREEIAREVLRSLARTFAETAFFPRRLAGGRLPRGVRVEVDPETARVIESGRAAVLVTGHFGNWELTGQVLTLCGWRVNSVARDLDNPLLDRYVTAIRTRYGMGIVRKEGSVRGMARVLREGGRIAMLADQCTGRRGILVPFMGRPASTTPAPATMALRFGVPVIPGYGFWTGRGDEYVVRVEAPLMLPRTGDREEDVRALTAAMNRTFEAWVREHPGQWLWVHRRWKMRPHWFKEAGHDA